MVSALLARKIIVFLCTNALLMKRKLDLFEPSSRFSWTIHIDGVGARHDAAVCREGVFDKAVDAIGRHADPRVLDLEAHPNAVVGRLLDDGA